jgi:streptogramin lyase
VRVGSSPARTARLTAGVATWLWLRGRSLAAAPILAGVLLLGSLAAPGFVDGAEQEVSEYTEGLSAGSGPNAITRGSDGAMWFTEYGADRIGRIDASGTITEQGAQMRSGAHPAGIATGPEGDLYFAEFGTGYIGQLDPANGAIVGEYAVPSGAASGPDGITEGPDGALWFVEQGDGLVGRVDQSSHVVTEYTIHQHASSGYQPSAIVTGPEGDLWLTLTGLGEIARLDPGVAEAGTEKGVTLYDLPSGAGSDPEGITVGHEGDLYVAEYGTETIARVQPGVVSAGTSDGISEFPADGKPLLLTGTSDGAIWATEPSSDQLLRYEPSSGSSQVIASVDGVTGDATGVAEDGAGHVWFTQFNVPAIGRVALNPEQPGGGPSPGSTPAPTAVLSASTVKGKLTFNASGSLPNGSPITGYDVVLHDNAGAAEIHCAGGSPVAVPQFSETVNGTATLTVKAANGTSSSTSKSFSASALPSLHKPQAVHAAGHITPQVIAFQCTTPDGKAARGSEAPGTAPGTAISSSCEMSAGIVEVEGCGLRKVSDLCSGVPAPERSIIFGHLIPGKLQGAVNPCGGALVSSAHASAHTADLQSAVQKASHVLSGLQDAFYVSSEPVRINGIDVKPNNGAVIVLAVGGLLSSSFAEQYGVYLVSSEASEDIGDFALKKGKLDLDVSDLGAKEAQFASFNIESPVSFGHFAKLALATAFTSFGGVPSLPISGGFDAKFVKGGATRLDINLQVSKLFENPLNDLPFSGSTSLLTTNESGFVLNTLDINVPDLDLQVVDLSNIKMHWDRATNTISGQIGVDVDKIGGAIGGTFQFDGSDFINGGVFYQADEIKNGGGGGYLITPPIFLIGLSASFSLYQPSVPGSTTSFDGQASLSVGPALSNNGCGLLQANGDIHLRFYPGPFAISVVGTNEFLCIPLQQSYFSANSDGYASVGGDTELNIPEVFSAKMNLDGQAYVDANDLSQSHFQLDGSATATLDLPSFIGDVSVSGEAVVSDLGAGICAEIDLFGHHFHPGITESFSPSLPLTPAQFIAQLSLAGDGCSLSPYQPLGRGGPPGAAASRAHTSASSGTLKIPSGENTATVLLRGNGGAPSVTLTGPHGRTIDTASDGAADSDGISDLVLRQASKGTTLVELAGSSAGAWTFAPDTGSVPLSGIFTAHELSRPTLTAHVTGHGARRVLHYHLVQQPGLRVTFVELGKGGGQRLGVAKGPTGAISFTPSDAAAGARTITAVLSENGLPRPGFVVTRYTGGPPRPGRVSRITLRRRHDGLLVSFRRAALAQRYLVSVTLGDGRSVLMPTSGTSALIAGVPATTAVERVSVLALRGEERGPLATVRAFNGHG